MRRIHKLEIGREMAKLVKQGQLSRPAGSQAPLKLFQTGSKRFPAEHVRSPPILGRISPKAWWLIRATRVNAKRLLRRIQNRKAA